MKPTPQDIANFDQACTTIKAHACMALWSLFSGCVEAGFTRQEAVQLSLPLAKNIADLVMPVPGDKSLPEGNQDKQP